MPKRESVYEGGTHLNPIPFGCKIGNMFFTGNIGGMDPVTRHRPEDIEGQIEQMVKNLTSGLTSAGLSVDNIGFVRLFVKEESGRAEFNKTWVKLFPDENARPARHTEVKPDLAYLIGMEIIAVTD